MDQPYIYQHKLLFVFPLQIYTLRKKTKAEKPKKTPSWRKKTMTKEKLWKTQIKKLEKKLLGEKNVKITPPHLIANQTKLKKNQAEKKYI
jgi:hypothetical protein